MKMRRIIKYTINTLSYAGAFTLGAIKGFNLGTGHQSSELVNLGLIGLPVLNGLISMGVNAKSLKKAETLADFIVMPFEKMYSGAIGSIGSGICEGIGVGCGALAGYIAKHYSNI